jgi:hypothetical protein
VGVVVVDDIVGNRIVDVDEEGCICDGGVDERVIGGVAEGVLNVCGVGAETLKVTDDRGG